MPKTFALRLLLAAALAPLAAAPALLPSAAVAAADDPAAVKIAAFDDSLIQLMKAGATTGPQGRFKLMAPAVDAAFDLPTMARLVVGLGWTTASADDRATVVKAFRRYTIANYVKNFSSYSGQKIELDPNVLVRGLDKVVKTKMTGGGDVSLMYRMRQSGGSWKVIDVLYNGGVSQLTIQRSDFAGVLASGGPKAFAVQLDTLADKLLK